MSQQPKMSRLSTFLSGVIVGACIMATASMVIFVFGCKP